MLFEILHTTILVDIGILSGTGNVRSFIYNMESARRTPGRDARHLVETDGTAVKTSIPAEPRIAARRRFSDG